jgi:hydroxymethylbilane synthase
VEALSPDGRVRFRHAGEADMTELSDLEASAQALGLSLGVAVRDEAGDAISI